MVATVEDGRRAGPSCCLPRTSLTETLVAALQAREHPIDRRTGQRRGVTERFDHAAP